MFVGYVGNKLVVIYICKGGDLNKKIRYILLYLIMFIFKINKKD